MTEHLRSLTIVEDPWDAAEAGRKGSVLTEPDSQRMSSWTIGQRGKEHKSVGLVYYSKILNLIGRKWRDPRKFG